MDLKKYIKKILINKYGIMKYMFNREIMYYDEIKAIKEYINYIMDNYLLEQRQNRDNIK